MPPANPSMATTSFARTRWSADAYHVAAGFLLKLGDQGLAHLATDRSMTAALASQDPLTVGASARIVTHTLMSSGHLAAAIATARNHAARLDHEIGTQTPESLSVYGSVLLRGAIAAALHDERGTAHEMLAEAADAARRRRHRREPARDSVRPGQHPDAPGQRRRHPRRRRNRDRPGPPDQPRRDHRHRAEGQPAHRRRPGVLPVGQVRAGLRGAARGGTDRAAGSRRAASVRALARNLAAVAPASIRRDAGQFASRIGATT